MKLMNSINLKSQKIVTNQKGFSLAEIMIVLVIIGAIMGLILPKIREGQDNSNIRNTKMKMAEIENKINEYFAECTKYPKNLEFLVEDQADCKNWSSNKNLKNLLKDAWGNDFSFEGTENGFNLSSLGKDKKEGGTGPDKDFYSEGSQAAQE